MDSKVSEKDMREVYFQAFGKEYDSANRKQAPLPLEIAYFVAINKLKREGKYTGGGEITDDIYFQSVNHFIYFCMNYPRNFLDAFGSLKNHLSNKFKNYYNKYGTYGVMIQFYAELDAENRRTLTDYSLKNYKGTPIDSDVSEIEYFNSVNHFIFFCFNFPSNFMDAFSSHLKVHLSSKWTNAYEKKGNVGAMIYFWSELDNENRRKLADWVRVNYTGTKLYEVGGALGDVAGMLPSPLPMSTIQAMADGGQLELFADGGGVELFRPTKKQMDKMKKEPFNPNIPMENHKDFSKLGLDKTEYSPKLMNIGRWVDVSDEKGLVHKLPYKIISLQKNYKDEIIYRGANQHNDFGLPISEDKIKRWLTENEALKMYNDNINYYIDNAYNYADGGGVDYYELQDLKNKESVLEKELHQISDNQSDGWRIDLALVRSELESVREEISKLENKYADGGGVKSDYYIFEGVDNLNGKPLYRVESTSESDNEYVGEWHTDKSDAEKELKSFYADGGGVDDVKDFIVYTYNTKEDVISDNKEVEREEETTEKEVIKLYKERIRSGYDYAVIIFEKGSFKEIYESNYKKTLEKYDDEQGDYADGGETMPIYTYGIIDGEKFEVIGVNQKKGIVKVKNFSKFGTRDMRINDWIPYTFELGTPAKFIYNGREVSGEVVTRNGEKAISLYKDDNYGGDSERIIPFTKIDLKTLRPFMEKETFGLGGFLLGAGIGIAGSYLYNNVKVEKDKKEVSITIKKPKKVKKDSDDMFQEREERASRRKVRDSDDMFQEREEHASRRKS